ncbi:unnamed protein product [Closterium sp. Yama58-4]|nr:unnamed protein product [Closterium sp. Yama58-4]
MPPATLSCQPAAGLPSPHPPAHPLSRPSSPPPVPTLPPPPPRTTRPFVLQRPRTPDATWGGVRTAQFGEAGSLGYRMMFADGAGRLLSPWHHIPLYAACDTLVHFVCTTPVATWAKMEIARDEDYTPLRFAASEMQVQLLQGSNDNACDNGDGKNRDGEVDGDDEFAAPLSGSPSATVARDARKRAACEAVALVPAHYAGNVLWNHGVLPQTVDESTLFRAPPSDTRSASASASASACPAPVNRSAGRPPASGTSASRDPSVSGGAGYGGGSGEGGQRSDRTSCNKQRQSAAGGDGGKRSGKSGWGFRGGTGLGKAKGRAAESVEDDVAAADDWSCELPDSRLGWQRQQDLELSLLERFEMERFATSRSDDHGPNGPDSLSAAPIEVIEIGQQPARVGQVYAVKPLGAIPLVINDRLTWKLIAVSGDDPLASKLESIEDLPAVLPGTLEMLQEWLLVRDDSSADQGEAADSCSADREGHDHFCAIKEDQRDRRSHAGDSSPQPSSRPSPRARARPSFRTVLRPSPRPRLPAQAVCGSAHALALAAQAHASWQLYFHLNAHPEPWLPECEIFHSGILERIWAKYTQAGPRGASAETIAAAAIAAAEACEGGGGESNQQAKGGNARSKEREDELRSGIAQLLRVSRCAPEGHKFQLVVELAGQEKRHEGEEQHG